jgi:hypothetical protein
MKTIWTFGDSFTSGDGCVETLPIGDGDFKYYNEYKQPDSDIWPNILGKTIGFNVKNIGKSGASNDYIIDSIIDNFDNIEFDDIVIIEKTFYQRFDVPDLCGNKFRTHYAEYLSTLSIDLNKNKYINNKLELETILNYSVLFSDNLLFKKRQDKRFNFIEKQLRNKINKILIWDVLDFFNVNIETIGQHTNGKIKDYHFSFNGHKSFSEFLYKKLYADNTKLSLI